MTRTALYRTAVVIALLISPTALFAQGCAMCYQSAASSGSQFIQALRHGILIMLFPPILFTAAIFYAAYRKRDQFNTGGNGAALKGIFAEEAPPEWTVADEGYVRKLVEDES